MRTQIWVGVKWEFIWERLGKKVKYNKNALNESLKELTKLFLKK